MAREGSTTAAFAVFEGYGTYIGCGGDMIVKQGVEGRSKSIGTTAVDNDNDLQTIPYRDLQALAKRAGIRANLKKGDMIRAIQKQRQCTDAATSSHGTRFASARRRRGAALAGRARRAGWGDHMA